MSYSRWGGSRWYTFWAGQDKATENRATALFEICSVETFTAEEIRGDIERCLTRSAEKEDPAFVALWGAVSDSEREELQGYMLEFLADVDDTYPE